jgi:hypothetical protein
MSAWASFDDRRRGPIRGCRSSLPLSGARHRSLRTVLRSCRDREVLPPTIESRRGSASRDRLRRSPRRDRRGQHGRPCARSFFGARDPWFRNPGGRSDRRTRRVIFAQLGDRNASHRSPVPCAIPLRGAVIGVDLPCRGRPLAGFLTRPSTTVPPHPVAPVALADTFGTPNPPRDLDGIRGPLDASAVPFHETVGTPGSSWLSERPVWATRRNCACFLQTRGRGLPVRVDQPDAYSRGPTFRDSRGLERSLRVCAGGTN